MKRFLPACTLAAALALGLTLPAQAAESATAATSPAASPPVSVATFLAQLATPKPAPGAPIGIETPVYATCPGIAYCSSYCRENGSNCVSVYHCYVNGTWSCDCYGPGGYPCD